MATLKIETVRELIYYSYANLAMAHTANEVNMHDFKLNKSDKKLVRELMEVGLQAELRDFKHKVKTWVNDKTNAQTDKEWFWELHNMLEKFSKHIQWRYDGYTGGDYPMKMLELQVNNLIPEKMLAQFSPDFQEWLRTAQKRMTEE